ncbi:hypothetical protein [Methylomonas rosea]|uniref:Uncharacterized protein n=1 Tax=Methylomonas rosea TaxID=2952227 RepID=A0ABT1TX10_9GAMM|nr:hypothetical protein [Methylomonas sp. WSC-7]MCQ8118982.1 hypothetical protein [Methylomonas sp. WSC-7]
MAGRNARPLSFNATDTRLFASAEYLLALSAKPCGMQASQKAMRARRIALIASLDTLVRKVKSYSGKPNWFNPKPTRPCAQASQLFVQG